jgi:hypothetical protein
MIRDNRQILLFDQSVVPLRNLVYDAMIHRHRLQVKNIPAARGLIAATNNLTRVVDAILNADTVGLRLAGVTPQMANELAKRLQTAAGALTVVRS